MFYWIICLLSFYSNLAANANWLARPGSTCIHLHTYRCNSYFSTSTVMLSRSDTSSNIAIKHNYKFHEIPVNYHYSKVPFGSNYLLMYKADCFIHVINHYNSLINLIFNQHPIMTWVAFGCNIWEVFFVLDCQWLILSIHKFQQKLLLTLHMILQRKGTQYTYTNSPKEPPLLHFDLGRVKRGMYLGSLYQTILINIKLMI